MIIKMENEYWKIIVLPLLILVCLILFKYGRGRDKIPKEPSKSIRLDSANPKVKFLSFKKFLPAIIAILIGILYGFEKPKYVYYQFENGQSKEISEEYFQFLKKENSVNAGWGITNHICKSKVFNIIPAFLYGLIALCLSLLIIRTLDLFEQKLTRVENE